MSDYSIIFCDKRYLIGEILEITNEFLDIKNCKWITHLPLQLDISGLTTKLLTKQGFNINVEVKHIGSIRLDRTEVVKLEALNETTWENFLLTRKKSQVDFWDYCRKVAVAIGQLKAIEKIAEIDKHWFRGNDVELCIRDLKNDI